MAGLSLQARIPSYQSFNHSITPTHRSPWSGLLNGDGRFVSEDVELLPDLVHVDDEGLFGTESSTGFCHQRSGRGFVGGEVGMTDGRESVGHAERLCAWKKEDKKGH